jgi:hypothetical protein
MNRTPNNKENPAPCAESTKSQTNNTTVPEDQIRRRPRSRIPSLQIMSIPKGVFTTQLTIRGDHLTREEISWKIHGPAPPAFPGTGSNDWTMKTLKNHGRWWANPD